MYKNDNYGFRFKDWDIYNDARRFRKEINIFFDKLPKEEKYRLKDQAKRAINSVVLNIAESANRNTDKDKCVYINRSHCSLDEVVACFDCSLDDGYIDYVEYDVILTKAGSLARRLRSFNNHLRT
ncbi:four helix bundle protein [Patescibacteria group bacterium]|nr:four helix bundle protein [Patescibacteria group bacterium]